MGALMRATDWSKTRLGPVEQWPQSLRTMLGVVLGSRFAMQLCWGPDLLMLYNDAYRPILRDRHPAALAAPAGEVWAEVWDVAGPMAQGVWEGGPASWVEDQLLYISCAEGLEETYFTFSFSPVPGEDGQVVGLLNTVQETTAKVQGARQIRMLHELAARAAQAQSEVEAYRLAAEVLAANPQDLPFVLLYTLDHQTQSARLAATSGWPAERPCAATVALAAADAAWPLAAALNQPAGHLVEHLDVQLGPALAWAQPGGRPRQAMVLPLQRSGQALPHALLVAGLSPHRPLDARYRELLSATADQLAHVSANARAYEAERQRAAALAESDRAKTAFFSSISHEFRTPLTLILAQLEDARAGQALDAKALELLQRNAVRLLGLVNSLLDFTRIEAGRLLLSFEPTELGQLTTELGSAFRSLVQRAGLRLVLDCPPLPEPVYVDRAQWEKIVHNLMSNAFKFTWEGEIELSLRARDGRAELRVRDSGTGIPAAELPRLFERFHRVPNARGRSFEGSGIGLALVQELVKLHGGEVRVESVEGQGSCFTVSLPLGHAHLAPEQIVAGGATAHPQGGPQAALVEAHQWTAGPPGPPAQEPDAAQAPASGRVLVVDDNADMREFLCRMLRQHWQVESAADGLAALAAARAHPPDLVLSDVMMPGLDGFGLLRELRNDPRTRTLPVILLSARAGEEAVLEGLDIGADDYLAKPFTTQELLARVRTHLAMARARNELNTELARVNAELAAFSYSVAHDLRAPLRAINGFASLLRDELGQQLDAEAQGLLARVLEAAQRMAQMIDDLLTLSRLGRQGQSQETVDLSELARRCIAVLREQDPQRRVDVEIQSELSACGDPGLLRLLLDNLLGNAWKYSARQASARIEFSAQAEPAGTVYRVRDNGAGFDMRYAGKLFGVFQRLHGADEFPGTGIGLATAQRIVQRHGGRIWAESAVGAGASFYFTLGAGS